jgi:serine/threonine protein phosphatase PrpC
MQFDIAVCSYQGGRDYNEDNVRYFERNGVCVVAVADGLGGHGGGQIASALAADTIADAFIKDPSLDAEYVGGLFQKANREVLNAQTQTQKMKSTGVALFIKDGQAIWGHAGDSRLYYFADGRLAAQTLDHSVAQMAVFSGEITAGQIRHHEDRNRVIRAFGGSEQLKTEIAPRLPLNRGPYAFLLCTDGFWEYVLEAEMEQDLTESGSAQGWLNAMLKRLESRVPDDNDNYSAAAVYVFGKE